MSAAFTPGPWCWTDEPGFRSLVRSDHGLIADLIKGSKRPDAEREANARLIAAAPAMFEELSSLVSFVSVMFGRGPDCVIPEEVETPLGVPVKIGPMVRDAQAALNQAMPSLLYRRLSDG